MNLEHSIKCLDRLVADSPIKSISDALPDGAQIYLVGGLVRDSIMGKPVQSADLDCACSLTSSEIEPLISKLGFETVQINREHHTVLIKPKGQDYQIEITTLRSKDKAGQIVVGNSIEEDLSLRDFTINSLAFDYNEKRIVDPLNGFSDLKKGIIRASGDASLRFAEDPLRILRLFRFHSTLGFEPEAKTLEAANSLACKLSSVAKERIRDELSKLLVGQHAGKSLLLMSKTEVLGSILPEIARMKAYYQNEYHAEDLLEHTLTVLENIPPRLDLRLAALLHDVAKPKTLSFDEAGKRHFYKHEHYGEHLAGEILERLCYPHALINKLRNLVRYHMRPTDVANSGLRRLIRDTGDNFQDWRELKIADYLACRTEKTPQEYMEEIEEFDARVAAELERSETHPFAELAIDGNDLISLGIPTGPKIGEILRALNELVLEDPTINSKENLLNLIKKEFL